MANEKLPLLPSLTAITGQDLFYVVDVSDPTDDPTGSSKGITRDEILTNVNQIDFNTNPATPSPTGGTIYYDYNENALSYKPITNNNDVTVNLGQENLIKIYNGLGSQINNGQVVHITGATSGVPTVALANASKIGTIVTDSLAQSSGVATHDIPSGEYGFITFFGVVRDLNTATFTAGQEIFLSDTVDGGLTNEPNNIAITSRISTVGYCLESNATTGKILVTITNENPLQTLTQQEINVLLGNTISTGAYFYTGATTASTTTINVSPMRGWIVYNTGENATKPIVSPVYYSGGTNISITGISTSFDTYLYVNSGGTLTQTNTYPTPIERRENIFLGRVVHPNKTTILNVEQSVDYDVSPLSSLRDLWVPIKLINEGVTPSSNGVNLTFKTSSGTFWGNGIGWPTNVLNPNSITVPAYNPASFYYTTQTGGTFVSTTTTVDTTNYDVGGVITNVPGSGNFTTQRIFMSQSGVIRIQYGQNYYSTLAKAISAIPSETFVNNIDNTNDSTLIGLLTVKDGTSDLSNVDDAVFSFVSKFGEVLGGTAGISTTSLQQAYDNSVNPEILTNSTLGPLSIKNGDGADNVSNLFEGVNSGGTVTMFVRADGSISATTITATTISATTYQNLPTDVRVTGGTYSSSTGDATFTNNTGGTFNVSGFFKPSDDIYVTGGTYSNGDLTFTNKTGGTFSVLTSTNYDAGVISGATYTSTGTGQINLPAIKVALYDNANNIEPIIVYDVASGTTGSGGIPSLVDQDTNYIVVEYNGGTPRYYVYDNDGVVNDSSVVLFMIVYRLSNFVHTLEFGNQGAGLANKLNDRFIMTDRFGWESGLSLGLSGSTGVVTVTEGVAWNASYRQALTAVNSQDDIFFKNYHSGGVWTYTTTGDTLNNTYYDNGTNIVELTAGKYLVNWYFRGQEVNDHLYEVYGNNEYDSVAEAELSVEPLLPELITSHAFLLGRIIVLKSETTGVTQSAFVRVFQSTQVDNHEDLIGLQGGGPGEYYHLTSSQYNNLPYKNSGNTFTQGQVFTNGVTANTMNISSTPTTNDSPTEVLTRNSTTGQIEITSPQSPGLFNYGLANAIMTGNFLT